MCNLNGSGVGCENKIIDYKTSTDYWLLLALVIWCFFLKNNYWCFFCNLYFIKCYISPTSMSLSSMGCQILVRTCWKCWLTWRIGFAERDVMLCLVEAFVGGGNWHMGSTTSGRLSRPQLQAINSPWCNGDHHLWGRWGIGKDAGFLIIYFYIFFCFFIDFLMIFLLKINLNDFPLITNRKFNGWDIYSINCTWVFFCY